MYIKKNVSGRDEDKSEVKIMVPMESRGKSQAGAH
jgi:hypothetical protein